MGPKISLQTMKLLVNKIWGFYSVLTLILLGYLANDLTFCKNIVLNVGGFKFNLFVIQFT